MDATERVRQLEEQLQYYQQQQSAITDGANAVLQQALQGAHQPLESSESLDNVQQQVQLLSLLASTRAYVAELKDVVDQARQVERQVRAAQGLPFEDVEALVDTARAAARLYSSTIQRHQQLASTSEPLEGQVPQPLLDKQAEVLQRLQGTRDELHQRLSSQIHHHLEQCGWPPPLAAAPRGQPGAADGPLSMADGEHAFDAAALFGAAHAQDVSALQRLLVALTDVQRLQEGPELEQGPAAASTTVSPPLLWAAQEVAAPLVAKLRAAFGGDAEAGRLDKPEWLLNTVLRLAKEYGPCLEFLQGTVEACGLAAAGYNFSVEFARSLRAAAMQLLREEKLPALAVLAAAAGGGDAYDGRRGTAGSSGAAGQLTAAAVAAARGAVSTAAGVASGSIPLTGLPAMALQGAAAGAAQLMPGTAHTGGAPPYAAAGFGGEQQQQQRQQARELWLHLVDCLVGFEIRYAPLLGVVLPDPSELPAVLLAHSTLSVLMEQPAWMDAWMEAEATAAAAQLDALLISPEAWGPATLLIAEDRPAWQCEFWPPLAAEKAVALLQALMHRVRYIPQPAGQRRYLSSVVAATLAGAQVRIVRMLQQADVFRDIVGLTWGPRVATCICFCHYLEHHLQEVHAGLPLSLHATAEEQADQQRAEQEQEQQAQLAHSQTNGYAPAAAAAAAANGGGPPHANGYGQPGALTGAGALPAPAPQPLVLSASARAAVRAVERAVTDFGSLKREWVLKVAKAVAQGFFAKASDYVSKDAAFKDVDPAAADSGIVSALLLDGLVWLQGCLAMLSDNLDATCFRSTWSAAAAAINRELFNLVATEHIFSAAGARQLGTDVGALVRVFAPFTRKPLSHFRELADAVTLLQLADEQAAWIHQAVSPASQAHNAADVLKTVGVYHLGPEQADTVLSLRM